MGLPRLFCSREPRLHQIQRDLRDSPLLHRRVDQPFRRDLRTVAAILPCLHLSDAPWAAIELLLPRLGGRSRVDDRGVISGILHRYREGLRWRTIPVDDGPRTTLFNRWNCWSEKGIWQALLVTLAGCGEPPEVAMVDSTAVRAHRTAAGAERGAAPPGDRPIARWSDDQDPRVRRRRRPLPCGPADGRTSARHPWWPRPAGQRTGNAPAYRRRSLRRR